MADKIENGSTSVFQVMQNLTFGELEQHAVGGYSAGEMDEADYPKVMAAINRGINQIQQDLSINENAVRLRLIEGILTYPIHSRHSIANGTDPIRYVDDSTHAPFEDDILRIQQIYNKEGVELPINTRNRAETVYVPQHNVIQHPFVKEGDVLGVVYTRFTRPVEVATKAAAVATYLPIPDYTLAALYAYVGGVMSAGITTNQEIGDSNNAMAKYEGIIAKLKYTPAIPSDHFENTNLTDRGFI